MSECILWTGRVGSHGYGHVNRERLAHRVAYELVNGPVTDGLIVHHDCGNKLCVNPKHLRAITHAEHNAWHLNAAAWYERQRGKTHCPHGHEYTPENTKVKRGRRHCRECNRVYMRAYHARRKALSALREIDRRGSKGHGNACAEIASAAIAEIEGEA